MSRNRKVDKRPPSRRGEPGRDMVSYDWQEFTRPTAATLLTKAIIRDADGLETTFTRSGELLLVDTEWCIIKIGNFVTEPETITLNADGTVEIVLIDGDVTNLGMAVTVRRAQPELTLENGIIHQGGSYPVPPFPEVAYDLIVGSWGGLNDAECIGGYFDDGAHNGELSYIQDAVTPRYLYRLPDPSGYGIDLTKGVAAANAAWSSPDGPDGSYGPHAPDTRWVFATLI